MSGLSRSSVQTYVDKYWDIPCDDNQVLLIPYSQSVKTAQDKLKKRGENAGDFTPVFVRHHGATDGTPQCAAGCTEEQLFLVRKSAHSKLLGVGYDIDKVAASDKEFVYGWSGLLDCAHYVSRCLSTGGVSVSENGVGMLVNKLRERSDTKTLANMVDKARAERIIKSGVMKVGDVIAYAHTDKKYYHSSVYMGGETISCHTMSRSPKFDSGWFLHPTDYLYTLIHFGHDDPAPSPQLADALAGWWEIMWQGTPYYYYFKKTSVAYVKKKPASTNTPISAATGRGYWVSQSPAKFTIFWTATGSVENMVLDSGGTTLTGTWNDSSPLTGTKL